MDYQDRQKQFEDKHDFEQRKFEEYEKQEIEEHQKTVKKVKKIIFIICGVACLVSLVFNLVNVFASKPALIEEEPEEVVEEVSQGNNTYLVEEGVYYAYAFGDVLKEDYLNNYYAVDTEDLIGGVKNKNKTTLYYLSDSNKNYEVVNGGEVTNPQFYLLFCVNDKLANQEYDDEFSIIALQNKYNIEDKTYLYLDPTIKITLKSN